MDPGSQGQVKQPYASVHLRIYQIILDAWASRTNKLALQPSWPSFPGPGERGRPGRLTSGSQVPQLPVLDVTQPSRPTTTIGQTAEYAG